MSDRDIDLEITNLSARLVSQNQQLLQDGIALFNELKSLKAELALEREGLRGAVKIVNDVQNLLSKYRSNSSTFLNDMQEASNINARFLSAHNKYQNEYLARTRIKERK